MLVWSPVGVSPSTETLCTPRYFARSSNGFFVDLSGALAAAGCWFGVDASLRTSDCLSLLFCSCSFIFIFSFTNHLHSALASSCAAHLAGRDSHRAARVRTHNVLRKLYDLLRVPFKAKRVSSEWVTKFLRPTRTVFSSFVAISSSTFRNDMDNICATSRRGCRNFSMRNTCGNPIEVLTCVHLGRRRREAISQMTAIVARGRRVVKHFYASRCAHRTASLQQLKASDS
jgi:hypothetical protein